MTRPRGCRGRGLLGWTPLTAALLGCGGPATTGPQPPSEAPRETIGATTASADPRVAQSGPGDRAPAPSSDPSAGDSDTQRAERTTCSETPEKEQPVRTDRLGDGPRMVRVSNQTGSEIQARLLDAKDQPVLPGTLRLAPGASGELRVPPGTYRLRYRLHPSCEVLRGSTIQLTGNRSEAMITLKARAKSASPDSVQRVREEL